MPESTHRPRTWGFRFSGTDAVVIGIFAIVAVILQRTGNPLWWILVIVAAHFFLFCNVFRVRRRWEIVWAVVFVVNCVVWLWFGCLDWLRVLSIQLPVTAYLIVAEVRGDRYHGLFARWANPRLNDYIEGRIQ